MTRNAKKARKNARRRNELRQGRERRDSQPRDSQPRDFRPRDFRPRDPQDAIRLRNPEDVLARVPYLVGYHPTESLVALAMDASGSCRFAVRCDLPDPPAELPDGSPHGQPDDQRSEQWTGGDQPAHLASALEHGGAVRALLVVYSAAPLVGAALIGPLTSELAAAGVEVIDAIRADGARWWSLTCSNSGCCPPEGRPYDLTANPITTQAIYRGEVALADEEELRRSVAPLLGATREAMLEVTGRVTSDVRRRYLTATGAQDFCDDGKVYLSGLVDRYLAEARPPTDKEVAWAGVFLRDVTVRDEVWLAMRKETASRQVALWREIAQRAVPPFDVAPTTLLAFAAWLAGEGALARCALERVLAADPGYSMAHLVRDALVGMVPPSVWPPEAADPAHGAEGAGERRDAAV